MDPGTAPEEFHDRGLWTIPNLISVLRLLAVPWFLWLLLHDDRPIAAGILLAIIDPIADRVLLIAGAVGLLIDGRAPRWVVILILARELVVSVGTLWLAALGARRIDVQWVGKAGTLAVMFALPMFLWLDDTVPGVGHDVLAVITWSFTIGGLILSYYAAAGYIPIAREALREGREARTPPLGAR